MSSKTKLIGLSIFWCGNEKSVHERPSWELAPYDCTSQITEDLPHDANLFQRKAAFSERARECGMVPFPTQFFFLDKAKALPIRIVSQTAWQTIRSDFIDNEEKRIAKDYTIGVISCDDCTIHGNLTYLQLPKVRSTCILFLSRKRSPHFSTFEVGRFG